jgi:aspartate/methionine/tyrosine aminotransferase
VGTPVDPTPDVVRQALRDAADAPGYPTTHGTAQLREAFVGWAERRLGARWLDPDAVLPTMGSKELVAWLPTLLGLGPGDRVVVPTLAYPTYAVGAQLAGAQPVASDSLLALGPQRVSMVWLNSPANPTGRVLPAEHLAKVVAWARERGVLVVSDSLLALGPQRVSMVWLNSPANPTGRVLPAEHLAKVVAWARERGVLVVSDECYVELPWTAQPVSVLHPDVCGGSHEGLLAVHSLSKRSNLAGYRAGFVAGDPAVVRELLEVRRHAGMMVPSPVQAAAVAALDDDVHVVAQRARYRLRRELLVGGLGEAGFRVELSEAGLYLWATRDEPCRDSVAWLAERGILVAPGEFYGAAGARHVRVALTSTDERVTAAAERLAGSRGGAG